MTGTGLPLPPADIPAAERPLLVQSDATLLLDAIGPWTAIARDAMAPFAHLERSPESIHTYRITPLSLWNAASAGITSDHIQAVLERLSRYRVPDPVRAEICEQVGRFGLVRLLPHDGECLELQITDPSARSKLLGFEQLAPFWIEASPARCLVRLRDRGAVKQALIKLGYPAEDLCGYVDGTPVPMLLRSHSADGAPFALRPYQREAVASFHDGGSPQGGAGVVVLPCGAGKTVVGIGAMQVLRTSTLILTANTIAVRQWRAELRDKTDLSDDQIGEYTGAAKEIRPVTITTYQMLTHRPSRHVEFPHIELLRRNQWGLLIYDEVHLLPAPVFRVTAEIQARRRLGMTATLIREDRREDDVFALIGPKRYDVPWRALEADGFLAEATCCEVRLCLGDSRRVRYALAPRREQFRIAAENPRKLSVVEQLIEANVDDAILVIGQFLDQLERIAKALGRPLITGKTPNSERARLYDAFRRGEERVLVVSKVANFAVDLPDASMVIQISGTYGSRQEEAQRLGRILRPKARSSRFFTLVSRDTREQEFAAKRQLFLVEQGYRYRILDGDAHA